MKDYLSSMLGQIVFACEDARREISEFNDVDNNFSVQSFVVKEKIPLGNHFHGIKDEIFVILKGSGEVTLVGVDYLFHDVYTPKTFQVKTGSVIYVPSWTAHTFVLEPGSEMICFSTKAFDKDDMRPYVLV